jgi:fused signal recognition particle receptor
VFGRIRKVFSKFVERATKILASKEKLEDLIEEFKLELVSNDVAYEAAEEIAGKLMELVKKGAIRSREELIASLRGTIRGFFEKAGWIDIVAEASSYNPYKLVFLGVNGVGKTTTIAKLAVLYRSKGFKPLMVAADTFRAGAQEQLKIHGSRTGIPVFMGKYGSDPAALAYDAITYAAKRGFNVVLIDTAGRMHTDVDLVNELRKIVRVVKPHRKILVVDALTGNDAVEQARFFNDAVGVDAVIVTKVDAYEQGGVPLSIVYSIGKPVIMMGIGQDYKDLKVFNVDEFLDRIIPKH